MNENLMNQLKANLDAMQKQLDELTKAYNTQQAEKPKEKLSPLREELNRFEQDYLKAMENVVDDEKCLMSNSHTIVKKDGHRGIQSSTFSTTSISNLDEDGMSTALEPFTNPKRISILKNLFMQDMTATEISMKTGCVGGQLYHHLNNLENAGLIKRENDKFCINGNGRSILVALFAVIGGMDIAKPDSEGKSKEFFYKHPEKSPIHQQPSTVKAIEIPSKPQAPQSPDFVPAIHYATNDDSKDDFTNLIKIMQKPKENDDIIKILKKTNENPSKPTEIANAVYGDDKNVLKYAIELALEAGTVSTSFLQSKLSCGYASAARIVDTMEKMNVISPSEGTIPRKLLINREKFDEMLREGKFGAE